MDDTAREMFAQLVRHYRQAVGSKSHCARIIGYTLSHLSRVESGERLPPPETVQDLDEGLSAGGALIEMRRVLAKASREGDTLATESADAMDGMEAGDVERRQLLQALGMTGVAGLAGQLGHVEAVRVTLEDALDRSVEEWQEVAWDYGRDYLTLRPADLVDEVARDVLAVRQLLDRPSSVADRISLQRVAGQLSALMAMTLGNLGEITHARRWWRTAHTAADRSGDSELSTWTRAQQATRALYEGTLDEAIALASRALDRGPCEVGAGKMLALTARGQALARRGDPEVHAAVEGATNAFGQLPSAVRANRTTVYGWSEQRLCHFESYVYAYLGDTRGSKAQETALTLHPQGPQEPAQIKLHRAGWLVRTGDPSEGLRYATGVVSALPLAHHVPRVMVLARDVHLALPTGADNTPEAVQYRELLNASSG